MKTRIIRIAATVTLLATSTAHAKPAASPWNGTWTLDAARSSPGAAEGAARAYRFTLRDGSITWEIPSLGEVVTGRTDGRPMFIRRHGKSDGMTLGVTAEGPATLRYRVMKRGAYFGGGLMMLVDDGKAWIDVTWGSPGPPQAAQLIYVRQP